jgi:hypothetical protein
MNWHFHSVARPESLRELVNEYSHLLECGLEGFIASTPLVENQIEAGTAEYPMGFFHADFSYRFAFSTGWYDKKHGYVKMGYIPYDVTMERADHALYASEVGLTFPSNRIRYIEKHSVIE